MTNKKNTGVFDISGKEIRTGDTVAFHCPLPQCKSRHEIGVVVAKQKDDGIYYVKFGITPEGKAMLYPLINEDRETKLPIGIEIIPGSLTAMMVGGRN